MQSYERWRTTCRLLTVEKHDATLGEVAESVRKEILDRRQRNGRSNAIEEKMLMSVLEFIK
ncbi:MAG: hypothetical protein M3M87_00840 [Thermoproteota archaeon]|nr:hypothetical protein [Thermoproteota archaeon]